MAEYEACIVGLRMAVDMNIKELLVIGDSDLLVHWVLEEWTTKNIKILPYLHCVKELCKQFTEIDFKHIPRIQNEFADALATLSSMIQHPDKNYIDPIKVEIYDQQAYYFHVDEELDGQPWYYDIKKLLEMREYPKNATNKQKRTLKRIWGTNVIGPIEHPTSNGHHFILVAIDYFSKWVEASTYKAATNKVVADFVRNNIVCRFGIPESTIIDNAANLNNDLMRETCEKFRMAHRNSTAYRPQMNGVIEAANKNIKKILRKIMDSHRKWHKKFPYALLGYCTTA
ncbi:uncharacterized protein LOC132045714 [Lycium ferocissimum]|uniref:uncharacterized protein LOC132045714 n=1 Tax=Lycium ferocissimum TaxID=112874 RepID=UPI0028169017|nr:uncharacterized protein LOC132045714 [Lycium ferocissimum]